MDAFLSRITREKFEEWWAWYIVEGKTREPHYAVMSAIYNAQAGEEDQLIYPEDLEPFADQAENRRERSGKMIPIDQWEAQAARHGNERRGAAVQHQRKH